VDTIQNQPGVLGFHTEDRGKPGVSRKPADNGAKVTTGD
jgi:hypothetical protein